jgi:hypothetical protein
MIGRHIGTTSIMWSGLIQKTYKNIKKIF